MEQLITVVVPACNEARFIARVVRSIPDYVAQVVVVDDGSSDGTSDLARETQRQGLVVLRHPVRRGVGAALATGYAHALATGAEVVAVMAGDGQMDPHDLQSVLEPVLSGRADYAKGDRMAHSNASCMPRARYWAGRVFSRLTSWTTGLSVRDAQCGYTAIHERALRKVPLSRLWRGYGYPNDLLGWLAAGGARVAHVTVRPIYADETSGLGIRHAVAVVPYVLLRVLLRRVSAARWARRARNTLPAAQPARSRPT